VVCKAVGGCKFEAEVYPCIHSCTTRDDELESQWKSSSLRAALDFMIELTDGDHRSN